MLSGRSLVDSAEFTAGEIELWDKPVTDPLYLFLPLPLHSLQGALENQQEFLKRLKLRGRMNKEWQRGLLVVMREVAARLRKIGWVD